VSDVGGAPRRFRLLALDIDGTLLRTDKALSPRVRAAVEVAQQRGVHVVLVTGRRYPAARRVARALGCEVPLVLHNGALIVQDEAPLRCVTLDIEVARRAIRAGRECGADPVVHSGRQGEGRLMIETLDASNTMLSRYLERSGSDLCRVPELCAALVEAPLQVMFGGEVARMAALRERLATTLGRDARIERTVYPRQGVGILDVLDPAVSKASALTFLQERWGVEAAETLAIGDNWNDHEMLQHAGLGLVMGNADPEMLALGLPVLPTNDEDGAAIAIERYVLGTADA
jgi:hydroxymethylpyrimidine pyrophosphatase-like HAD family hydrolase